MKMLNLQVLIASMTNIATMSDKLAVISKEAGAGSQMLTLALGPMNLLVMSVKEVERVAIGLGLPVSSSTAQRCKQVLRQAEWNGPMVCMTRFVCDRIVAEAHQLIQAFGDEIAKRDVAVLAPEAARYRGDASTLFGDEVMDRMPDAATDIVEGAACMRLGRWTATVMHLMRVLETGLDRLAGHVGAAARDNWEQTIQAVEAALRDIRKKEHGQAEERWAQETALHFRFIKNAHRNFAMHHTVSYDEEAAVQIWGETRSFMRHIASKLARPGP